MVSDFVKGNAYLRFPEDIRKGIRLHRQIDAFTDAHPLNRKTKQLLYAAAGRYSGAFLDIVYDHFLANDPARFTPTSLKDFSNRVYEVLERRSALLPPPFLQMLAHMQAYDWLFNYSSKGGIKKSLEGVVRRAQYLPDNAPVYGLFEQHYDAFQESYDVFFPELEAYAREQFTE